MGGDKHGDSAPGCTVYGLPKLLASIGIHTAGGLIEKHYARIVKNAHGKCQFLFPPQWQTLHEGIGLIAKLEACYHFFGLADYCTAIHTIYSAVEHQIFAHRKVVVKRKFLAHIAYVLFYLLTLGGYIISAHGGFAGCGSTQSTQHAHSGGFAGSICTQKPEYFALMHGKRNMVGGNKVAKLLGEVICLYHIGSVAEVGSWLSHIALGWHHFLRSTHGLHFAGMHQCYAVALHHFVAIWRAHHYGDAEIAAQAMKHCPKFASAHGVYSGGGLVEE